MKNVLCFFIFLVSSISAAPSDSQKMAYGLKLHQGFILQSLGQSTKAFFTFQSGYMEAAKAGEDPRRLAAISHQFEWYRKYGSYTRLFAIEPVGDDVIRGQYTGNEFWDEDDDDDDDDYRSFWTCLLTRQIDPSFGRYRLSNRVSLLAEIPRYESYGECEMSEHRRNYMFGVGEIIVGLLLIRAGHVSAGGWVAWDGIQRVFDVANPLLTRKDQIARQELEKSLNECKQVAPPK